MDTKPVIQIEGLKKHFRMKEGSAIKRRWLDIRAVDDVTLQIHPGDIMGVVGESGSGKTTLARLILGLTRPTAGSIFVNGHDIVSLRAGELKRHRRNVAVVFQDPASNLNPRQTIESSILRPMTIHGVAKAEARERAALAMDKVKMDTRYLKSYPHQLSGGQLQRIAVARALVLEPRVMILDEPTSALDISIQAQVLNLLLSLQVEMGLTYLVISHDLNVIRYISDKIAVMYLGKLVECGPSEQVFLNPAHPYTNGLMSAAPVIHPGLRGEKKRLLSGEPGSLIDVGEGCRLALRCPHVMEICKGAMPPLFSAGDGHSAACFLLDQQKTIYNL